MQSSGSQYRHGPERHLLLLYYRHYLLLNCGTKESLSVACHVDLEPDHKLTPKSCAEAGVGGKGSPQAFGSAGRYPHTCHQATGMIGGKTRPRLLHVRYKRIQMYGSISTGKLPSHQRDPMEGDCLTKPLLRGHVKVGELRTQRPRANRRWKCQHGHHTGMI